MIFFSFLFLPEHHTFWFPTVLHFVLIAVQQPPMSYWKVMEQRNLPISLTCPYVHWQIKILLLFILGLMWHPSLRAVRVFRWILSIRHIDWYWWVLQDSDVAAKWYRHLALCFYIGIQPGENQPSQVLYWKELCHRHQCRLTWINCNIILKPSAICLRIMMFVWRHICEWKWSPRGWGCSMLNFWATSWSPQLLVVVTNINIK